MFLVRSPGPPMTGRKAVLNTAIAALASDHEVDLFILAQPQAAAVRARHVVWLGTVSKPRIVCNAAWSALAGERSLNEALFWSRRLLARVRRLARSSAYDFAIADTVRAAPYADQLGVPWHLDLDDLLSVRYESYLEQADQLSAGLVLGYYRDSMPRAALALPRRLLSRLLQKEAACLRRRELYWAGKATTVSLVSPDEADRFARAASRRVHALPMSVEVPLRSWTPCNTTAAKPAFLGGLDYKPNLDALLYYQEKVFPALKAAHPITPVLNHIGTAPPELRRRFSPQVVRFDGYVSDVAARLSEADLFIAPIVSGTGIKTKVLEAMALGLPVLATRHAVSGLNVEHKKHCFICEQPAQFAEGLAYLANPGVAGKVGAAARRYVEDNFSIGVVRRRWQEVLHELAADPARCRWT